MEFLCSSSSFDPCPQNDYPPPQLLQQIDDIQGDQIAPTLPQNNDNIDISMNEHDLDHLLAQIPHFVGEGEECHGQRRKSTSSRDRGHESNEKKKQKMVHREVERQRRLEMASLHASLRSLLPMEFIKGKRSMSDHLDMAAKYIRHLRHGIQVITEKRDALKLEMGNFSKYDVTVNLWNNNNNNDNDNDKNSKEGVEVIVSISSSEDQGLPLSKVLHCLAKRDLEVVSCTSSRVANTLVHSIHAQVGDGRSTAIDPLDLQQKLSNINNFT